METFNSEHDAPPQPEFTVLKQRVDLDVDFAHRALKGTTEITVQPLTASLRQLRLHFRQGTIKHVNASGQNAKWEYEDVYGKLRMRDGSGVQQWQMLKERIQGSLKPSPEPELVVNLPKNLKIQELQLEAGSKLPAYSGAPPSLQKQESDALAAVEAQDAQSVAAPAHTKQFAPLKLLIEFEVDRFRDGLHWVGFEEGDKRYPYCYTRVQEWAGNTSSIFPCLDDAGSKYTWEFSVKCAKTLGDALKKPEAQRASTDGQGDVEMTNGSSTAQRAPTAFNSDDYVLNLAEEDAGIDLAVVCTGDLVDDAVDEEDETKHTVSFSQPVPVTARHIAFAIGPFQHVDLSAYREAEEEERLGQSAVKVDGYCLPGRADELQNTCFPLTMAIDHLGVNLGTFPFNTYQAVFVDDQVQDSAAAAGMGLFASRLLFPADIIEPLDRHTEILIRALANQWFGVSITPKSPEDEWIVAGCGGYMTDVFLKKLMGNNDFRWRQKLASEKVYELDVDRPSLTAHGGLLHLDPFIREFMDLKAKLVLFVLDRRILKSNATAGVLRIISKLLLNAKSGNLSNGELCTADFKRVCEKLGHNKLEPFFRQWVVGAGVPIFHVTQRFNKKKLVVEMTIAQRQLERVTKPAFEPSNYMREIKEYVGEVWAPEIQAVFTGPMTIRIHEADGTPYEHIVEIKEAVTKLEIPYNTKYKRLKRSRRQKERLAAATGGGEANAAGGGDDALLYCLGDILDTDEEKQEWQLADWTPEDEEKMSQESYEWIRMDADFEWIGKIHLDMPLYMHVSQLQQDRDLVAQYESMRIVINSNPHPMSFSILLRTLMDRRYFHGIRELAAEGLAKLAVKQWTKLGQFHLMKAFQELFCHEGSIMPKPNDFEDRVQFLLQCAIPQAMAKIRDEDGQVPMEVRRFFVDKLKFNDNSVNAFSDAHYVATLMTCLSDALIASHDKAERKKVEAEEKERTHFEFSFGDVQNDEDELMGENEDDETNEDRQFEEEAVEEIERYRRIDEYISTYQNVYSTTALECLQNLSKKGIVKNKAAEVLRYTTSKNADNVRLKAFSCLSETGMTRKMGIMKYVLHSLGEDHSPWFRECLLAIFCEALGHIAIYDPEPEEKPRSKPSVDTGALVLEEASTDDRAKQLEFEANRRRMGPESALVAQKAALHDEEVFRRALWTAVTSDTTSVNETAALLDIASLMFEPENRMSVILNLPRGYRARHLGRGKMHFYRHGPHLTKPAKPLPLEDWESVQQLGLTYTGALSNDVRKAEKLRLQIEEAQHQKDRASSQMPPPDALPTPSSAGGANGPVKLSLKRKSNAMDASSREDSPKPPKMGKTQAHDTPKMTGSASTTNSPLPSTPTTAAPKDKPKGLAVPKARRNSNTPSLGTSKPTPAHQKPARKPSLLLKLPLTTSKIARVQEILSRPPNPTAASKKRKISSTPSTTTPTATATTAPLDRRTSTPLLPQSNSAAFWPSMSPTAPASTGTAATAPGNAGGFRSYGDFSQSPAAEQGMNLGGFRSFGGSGGGGGGVDGDDGVKLEEDAPLAGQVRKLGSGGGSGSGGRSGSGNGNGNGSGNGDAEPPLKKTKTLKLKLGKKKEG